MQIVQLLISLISRILMEQNPESFIKFYTILAAITTLISILRVIKYPKFFKNRN